MVRLTPPNVRGDSNMAEQWLQQTINLSPKSRGFHLIDDELFSQLDYLHQVEVGLLHLFLLHTSASLSINENACPDVRADLESHYNQMVPESMPYYTHTLEGPDDMPAHIKSSILGNQLTLPLNNGKVVLGTWQGIYLCEHRDHASGRRLIATVNGKLKTN
jgi:secondary thiamine-phosphate synthase enzyme